MARNYKTLADAIQYFEEIGEELNKLEKKVKKIKHSKEYKKHINTMKVYANRGIIDDCPTFKNSYSIPEEVYLNNKIQKTSDFLSKFLDKKG